MKARLVAGALVVAGMVIAQTQVDIKSQTKDINFSGASFVIPFPTGGALPAGCAVGSMFFNSSAPPGANLYGCATTNSWALESGGTGGSSGGTVGGVLSVANASATALTIGGSCSVAAPCLVQIGSTVYAYTAPATLTVTGGAGTAYLFVDSNGNITAGESAVGSPILVCSGCVLVAGMTQFPPGALPLAIWTAGGGVWVSGNSEVALQSGAPSFSAGSNVTLTQTANSVNVAASFTAFPSGAQPVCAASTGGFPWYTPGGSGVKDSVQVCAKDATNAYAWRTLF